MAAPSSPRRFAAWRVEAPFFPGFPVWWPFQFAVYLSRCLTLHDPVPCFRDRVQAQCSRPYDILSCYSYSALWLGQCQSLLTQTQHPNEHDMVCYRISLFGSSTCSQAGPFSLVWPVALTGRLDQPGLSLSGEDTGGEHLENAQTASPHLPWRRDALQPLRVQRYWLSRNTCVHIPDDGLRCITWNTRGLIGSPASPQLLKEKKHIYFT